MRYLGLAAFTFKRYCVSPLVCFFFVYGFMVLVSCRPFTGTTSQLQDIAGATSNRYIYKPAQLNTLFADVLSKSNFKLDSDFCIKSAIELATGSQFVFFFDSRCETIESLIKSERDPPYAFRFSQLGKGSSGLLKAVDNKVSATVGEWQLTRNTDNQDVIEVMYFCWKSRVEACELAPGVNGKLDSISVRQDGTYRTRLIRLSHRPFDFIDMLDSVVGRRSFTSRLPCSIVITEIQRLSDTSVRIILKFVETTKSSECSTVGQSISVMCQNPSSSICTIEGGDESVEFDYVSYRILRYDNSRKETFFYAIDPADVKFLSKTP